MKKLRVLTGMLMLGVFHLADAGIVTIDPSYYADGTDLSDATAGVTLSTWSWRGPGTVPTYAPVYGSVCNVGCGLFQGQRIFGDSPDGSSTFHGFHSAAFAKNYIIDNDPAFTFSVFRADFDSPTNFVQLLMGAGEEVPWVSAFDREGHLVAECYLTGFDVPCGTGVVGPSGPRGVAFVTLATDTDNIAFLVAGGASAWSRVASLTFVQTSVPEPAAFGLLACGLIGMWAARRRRRTRGWSISKTDAMCECH